MTKELQQFNSKQIISSNSPIEELYRFAKMLAGSKMVPQQYKNDPDTIFVAMQAGSEVGLSPMQSVQSINCANQTPALYGDGLLAVCQASNKYLWHKESTFPEIEKTGVAWCLVMRKGWEEPQKTYYSKADAIRAGNWSKHTYVKFPSRMLLMRARAFALRGAFADALRGLASYEELKDWENIQNEKNSQSTKQIESDIKDVEIVMSSSKKSTKQKKEKDVSDKQTKKNGAKGTPKELATEPKQNDERYDTRNQKPEAAEQRIS